MGNNFGQKKDNPKPEEKAPTVQRETTLLRKGLSKSTPDLLNEDQAASKHRKFVKIGNIKVSVILGKITEEKADVLVNSVNSDLDLSKGQGSKAISDGGGEVIQNECRKNYPSGISGDEIAVTGGGNLKCNKVYHIHLPKWREGKSCQALQTAVINCLKLAKKYRVTSLAFPPFGSGYLKYPEDDIADKMFQAVIDFEGSNHSTSIKSVVIVCHKSQSAVFQAFERKAREVSGSVMQGNSSYCKCGHINVVIQRGSITNQKAEVIVATTSHDLNLKKGVLSSSLLKAAGPSLQLSCDNNFPSGVEFGELAVTRGYNLPCRFVYWSCLPEWKNNSDNYPKQVLAELITNCLEKADSYDVQTMAFPTLGTGALKYPPDVMAETLKKCITDFQLNNRNSKLHHIYIVVYDKSKDYFLDENALMKQFMSKRGRPVTPTAPPPPVVPSAPPLPPSFGTKQFQLWIEQNMYKPPRNWSIYQPNKSKKECKSDDKKYQIVKVSQDEMEAVTQIVESTWLPQYIGKGRDGVGLEDLDYTKIKVLEVERVENAELFKQYSEARADLFQKAEDSNSSFSQLEAISVGKRKRGIFTTSKADNNVFTDIFPEINEHYLFHGTQEQRISSIAANGFDLTLKDKSMFGAAIYTSESSTKSDQYADPKNQRDKTPKKMFLLRVLLGEIFVTTDDKKFSRPPCKTCKDDKCQEPMHNIDGNGFYDSVVVDGQWNFREFMTFDPKYCYPEYVITYLRV